MSSKSSIKHKRFNFHLADRDNFQRFLTHSEISDIPLTCETEIDAALQQLNTKIANAVPQQTHTFKHLRLSRHTRNVKRLQCQRTRNPNLLSECKTLQYLIDDI